MSPTNSTNAIRHLLVGMVFLGGLALLGWMTLSLDAASDLPLIGEVFGKRLPPVKIRFARVNSLRDGDDVLVKGFRIGRVSEIEYDTDRNDLVVTCSLDQEIRLTDDTEFLIRSSSALGGRHIEIVPSGEGREREPGHIFQGEAESDFQESLSRITSEVEQGTGLLPRLLKNEEFANDVQELVERISLDIREQRGIIGMLLSNERSRDELQDVISSLRGFLADLREGEGLLPRLVRDGFLADEVETLVVEVSRDIRTEQGVLGLLVHNQEAKQQVADAVSNIDDILANAREGKGVMGRLFYNEDLAENLEDAVVDVHEIVHKANSGDGTLGQVINNPEAWEELVRILNLAREAIEDLREQAPISTFANVLFLAL